MKINITNVLTLDDNKDYVVVSKVKYNKINYYYLSEINNPSNVIFCYEDKDELVELKDNNLILKLLPTFVENTKQIVNLDELKAAIEKNS